MAFDWSVISAQKSPEDAYYRLLGEMLHRSASAEDLQRLRDFLSSTRLSDDVWLSLGEGLYHTTSGHSIGYRMWCAWSKVVLRDRYDEREQLEAWHRVKTATSDALELSSDAEVDEPITTSLAGDARPGVRSVETRVVGRMATHDRIAQNPAAAIALLPSGPHTVRLFDQVFEGVDEFVLLDLLRGGVFLGLEVLFGVRWINVLDHPGFVSIVQRLRDEAMGDLATAERGRAEVTTPGTR